MKNWVHWVIGTVISATGGYLYWYYVGCMGGSCAITSSALNSTIYGGVMGAVILHTFCTSKVKSDNNADNEEV